MDSLLITTIALYYACKYILLNRLKYQDEVASIISMFSIGAFILTLGIFHDNIPYEFRENPHVLIGLGLTGSILVMLAAMIHAIRKSSTNSTPDFYQLSWFSRNPSSAKLISVLARVVSFALFVIGPSITRATGSDYTSIFSDNSRAMFWTVAVMVTMMFGASLWRIGNRIQRSGGSFDIGYKVLLLRSFLRDNQSSGNPINPFNALIGTFAPSSLLGASTVEEQLVAALSAEVGPVITLGRPTEVLAPLGADRVYAQPGTWRDEVTYLLRRVSLVVVIVDSSKSLVWEIGEAIRVAGLSRLILMLPPKRDLTWYVECGEFLNTISDLPTLSSLNNKVAAIRFTDDGKPEIIGVGGDSATAQIAALRLSLMDRPIASKVSRWGDA